MKTNSMETNCSNLYCMQFRSDPHYLYGSLRRMQKWPPDNSKSSQDNKSKFQDFNNWIFLSEAFPQKMAEKNWCKV
jgi:hypothetical protein